MHWRNTLDWSTKFFLKIISKKILKNDSCTYVVHKSSDISNQILYLKVENINKEIRVRAIGNKSRIKLIFGRFSKTKPMCSSSGTYLWYSSSLCTDSAKTLLAPMRVRRVAPALKLCAGKENSHLLIRIIQERPYTGRHHHLGAALAAARWVPRGRRRVPAHTSYPCHRLWELVAVGVWAVPFSKHHAKETSRWDLEFRFWFFCFLSWLKANLVGRGQDHHCLN